MKYSTAITALALLSSGANAFAPSSTSAPRDTSLNMETSRRAAFATITSAAVASSFPTMAFALGGPTYDNMKLVYDLGMSLDKLKEKVADPDQSEAALVGLRAFNRDPNFYTGYARNFISKSVKNNADGDVRVGYIRQASSVISSIQELLEGRQGLYGADASKEAVARVDKAQALIGKFLLESGIDEKKESFEAYAKAHPY